MMQSVIFLHVVLTLRSGTLLCPLYIQLHTACDYLLCGQVANCVLCNPHSHVESYKLHSEKYRSEKCHE